MFLTADQGMFSFITTIFGFLMNFIYNMLSKIGIESIGWSIIIFTLITRVILYPMTIKQQKSTKLMSIIQPEINAIQKKYEGKKDQISLMNQNQEIKEVYEKYGTSMTGGCLQILIQMPIIFALYRVIMNIPAYVGEIRNHYVSIVNAIGGVEAFEKIKTFASDNKLEKLVNFNVNNITEQGKYNLIIDFLYKLNPNQLKLVFNSFSEDIIEIVSTNLSYIEKANSFFGLNLSTSPSTYGIFPSPNFNFYLLIPIFAFLTQYASVILMQKANTSKINQNDENNQMQQTMKAMNITMPIMSMVFTYTFATGIGLYWIASSLFMGIQQLIVNYQLSKIDINEMIKKNIEKANKKRAKKGLKPIDENKTVYDIKKMEEKYEKEEERRNKLLEGKEDKEKEAEKFYFENEDKNSLSAKANMVLKYNQKNDKK